MALAPTRAAAGPRRRRRAAAASDEESDGAAASGAAGAQRLRRRGGPRAPSADRRCRTCTAPCAPSTRGAALERDQAIRALAQRNAARGGSPLSWSLGVVEVLPDDAASLDDLLTRADAAMYEVKRARRAAR
jgi:hypothetical protein